MRVCACESKWEDRVANALRRGTFLKGRGVSPPLSRGARTFAPISYPYAGRSFIVAAGSLPGARDCGRFPHDQADRRLQGLRRQEGAPGLLARRRRGRDDGHHRLLRHRKVGRDQAHRRTARAGFGHRVRGRPGGPDAPRRELYALRARIGYVFQFAALFDSLTIGDNVAMGLRKQQELQPSEIHERVHEALELVDLPDTSRPISRPSCRAACASASASRARSRCAPSTSSTTSRPPDSIPSPAPSSTSS